jgi:hypothetical protein
MAAGPSALRKFPEEMMHYGNIGKKYNIAEIP